MGLFNPITSLEMRLTVIISMRSDKVIMNLNKFLNGSIKIFFSMIAMRVN